MLYKITKIPAALISGYYMFKFAWPKLMAKEISVNSFNTFGEQLSINGKLFMYFTGIVELVIVLGLVVSLFLKKSRFADLVALSTYSALLATMSGALLIEYFVRPEPVDRLVAIAASLMVVSVFQIIVLIRRIKGGSIGSQR